MATVKGLSTFMISTVRAKAMEVATMPKRSSHPMSERVGHATSHSPENTIQPARKRHAVSSSMRDTARDGTVRHQMLFSVPNRAAQNALNKAMSMPSP